MKRPVFTAVFLILAATILTIKIKHKKENKPNA